MAELERASAVEPSDPAIANDLAAASIVLSELQRDPRPRLGSLAILEQALAVDPGYVPALINRAVALESLSLGAQATSAWREAQAETIDSRWKAEAGSRAASLESPSLRDRWQEQRERLLQQSTISEDEARTVARTFAAPLRLLVEDELLPAWGEALQSGDVARSGEFLGLLDRLAAALGQATGETTLERSIALLPQADEREAMVLAGAHAQYGRARKLHQRAAFTQAAPLFAEAARGFRSAGSPFAAWAELYLAVGVYQQGDYPRALAALRRIRSPGAVGAYVEWMVGLIRSRQARFEEVIEHAEAARRWFLDNGETENVAQMDVQLATSLHRLGKPLEAWQKFDAALAVRSHIVTSRRDRTLLAQVGRFLLQEDRREEALLFFREGVREADRSNSPIERSLVRANLASGLAATGRIEDAEEAIEQAMSEASRIEDVSTRRDTLADVGLVEAALEAETDKPKSLLALRRAETFARQANASLHLIQIYGLRAKLLEADDPEAAELAFDRAMQEIRRRKDLLGDPADELSYLQESQSILEAAVAFDLERNHPERAFERQEGMRTLLLNKSRQRRGLAYPTRNLAEIRRSLPTGDGLLVYVVLPDELVVFVVGQEIWRVHRYQVERQELKRTAQRWVESLRGPAGQENAEAGAWLTRLLVPPEVTAFKRLVLIPAGDLHSIPFAALPAGSGSARIVDRMPILIAPGASAYLDFAGAPRSEAAAASLLLVGGFAHSGRHYPQLSGTLRGYRRVSDTLRAAAWSFDALSGPDATAGRFLREFPQHRVVIFTGHGIAAVSPLDSAGLVLAPAGEDDDGFVSVHDIERIGEPVMTRLVILASCGSGAGPVSASEGPLSIARPFFEVGVDSVVASLWEVEDRETGRFIADLVAGGRRPTAATLREVQMRWEQRGEPAASWSAFQWLGRGD